MIKATYLKTGIIGLFFCCMSCTTLPKGSFGKEIPEAPDYAQVDQWAALPTKADNADAVPLPEWKDVQEETPIDVFFIHPTTLTGKPGEKEWNASLTDEELNERTDESTIRYQASIFNGVGKVYSPRFRQAHLHCFYTKKTIDAANALELAYEDVRAAFQYYLDHYNNGRPFIIASHSQGTFHAKKLVSEFVDGKPLQKQFIVAYLVGLSVPADLYTSIPPCQKREETGCFCSWRTVREGYMPKILHFPDSNIVVTNPVTWDASITTSTKEEQLGAVLKDFKKVYPELVRTTVHEDLLWVNKPKFPGSFLLTTKNYHIADYNFFYADIRQNAQDRVNAFLRNR